MTPRWKEYDNSQQNIHADCRRDIREIQAVVDDFLRSLAKVAAVTWFVLGAAWALRWVSQ